MEKVSFGDILGEMKNIVASKLYGHRVILVNFVDMYILKE